MEISKLMTSFFIFALFVISLVAFSVTIGTNNNASSLITDNNSAISSIYSGVNSTINTYNSKSNDSYFVFNSPEENTGVLSSISEFFISSILYVGKTIMGGANAIFNATFLPILKAIGLPTDVARVVGIIITIIMLFSIILMAWSLYRTGR